MTRAPFTLQFMAATVAPLQVDLPYPSSRGQAKLHYKLLQDLVAETWMKM